jgi:hypothetical protein
MICTHARDHYFVRQVYDIIVVFVLKLNALIQFGLSIQIINEEGWHMNLSGTE